MRSPTPEDLERLDMALSRISLPDGVSIRPWQQKDFSAVQQISAAEGWVVPRERPGDMLSAWHHSWPALVALDHQGMIIGFLRALSDGKVTTYVAEILVIHKWRGQGIGSALLNVCHHMYPNTRLDILVPGFSDGFYERQGFTPENGFRRSHL
jgi:GNAT superfamily N-acetyltransferase